MTFGSSTRQMRWANFVKRNGFVATDARAVCDELNWSDREQSKGYKV
jgi:hypothetical protein